MEIMKEFEKINIETYNCPNGLRYLDPIRNMFVHITPEETVRQKTILYMIEKLHVDKNNMFVEDHLIHYGVDDFNGRVDISILQNENEPLAVVECKEPRISISGMQVYKQGVEYASSIGAPYLILVNGLQMQFYHVDKNGVYVTIEGLVSYEDMIQGNFTNELCNNTFERCSMDQYKDISFLKSFEWYDQKIGEDTDQKLIPTIINLDDCFLDYSHKLTGLISDGLEIIEDLGVNFLNYGDASGSTFGSGEYRLFLINDGNKKRQSIIGFTIISTGKFINDEKYGTVDGKSVLCICRNDGDHDEMSVQINLNKFLSVNNGIAELSHSGVVTRKGASKKDLMEFVNRKNASLVKKDRICFGTFDINKSLYVDNEDVMRLIKNLISYAILRDEYKHSLSKKIEKCSTRY